MVDAANRVEVRDLLGELNRTLSILNSKHGINADEALKQAAVLQPIGIPLSIFNAKLGALESIVKYLREERGWDYATIAKVLNRNEGPIGVTYRRTLHKFSGRLDTSSEECIPFSIFSIKQLSVFEAIANHLALKGNDWHAIAKILHRHDKTVWTILQRVKIKLKRK